MVDVLGGFLGVQQGSSRAPSGSEMSKTQQEGRGVWEGRKGRRREFLALSGKGCRRRWMGAQRYSGQPIGAYARAEVNMVPFCFKERNCKYGTCSGI